MTKDNSDTQAVKTQLSDFLTKALAHVTFEEAVEGLTAAMAGKKDKDHPYSIWQLVEHIRIAQADILDFSKNADYKALKWPDDYWPSSTAPESQQQLDACIQQIKKDSSDFIQLLNGSENLFEQFSHGDGQNLFREAVLIIDHNAYHTGEIVLLRKLLGNWKS